MEKNYANIADALANLSPENLEKVLNSAKDIIGPHVKEVCITFVGFKLIDAIRHC